MSSTTNSLRDSQISESSIHYEGWRVAIAAQVVAFVCFASVVIYTFGVFLKPLSAEFGWSREEVSRAFGITAMTIAVSSPFLGKLLDRVEPRKVLLPCFAVFGLAFMSLGFLNGTLWHFYLLFFVIGIVGNGTTQMGLSRPVISWFHQKQGMALSLVLAGVGVGAIVMPMLSQYLIDRFGWRNAYFILGGMILIIGLPVTARWICNQSESGRIRSSQPVHGVEMKVALRSRAFWILVATLFLSSVSANGALTHLVSLLTDRGIAPVEAALAASILGGASLLGRLVSGWLLDRFWGPGVSMVLLFLLATGVMLLSRVDSLTGAAIAAVFIGIGLGGEADVTPVLLSRYYGFKAFGSLYGLTWTFYAMAGALGPVMLGRIFDQAGFYGTAFDMLAIPVFLSALLMLWMPRYPDTSNRPLQP